jgi:hypothetical protein
MVSHTQVQGDIAAGIAGVDRGFIPQETVVTSGYRYGAMAVYHMPFWRPVVAGTFFALSIFALSWYLMLGCHVGITDTGVLALGAGAAIWIWITSCVAFFFGGMIASAVSVPRSGGWLKGPVIWSLGILLGLVIYAAAANTGGFLAALDLPHAGIIGNINPTDSGMTAHFGFLWAAFITLACGLIFSIIGSAAGACACASNTESSAPATGSDAH